MDMPDIPDWLRVTPDEAQRRKAYWKSCGRLRHTRDMVFEAQKSRDPGTDRLRAELDARARHDDRQRKAERREAAEIRERQRAIPTTTPASAPAEPEEIDDVKKAAAKARPAKKARKTDRRQNPTARQAQRGSSRTRAKRARDFKAAGDVKATIVQQIADMMARPVGHEDAPLGGASTAEMVKATGIEAHPLRSKIYDVRHKLGYAVESPSKDNGMRYHATPPEQKREG